MGSLMGDEAETQLGQRMHLSETRLPAEPSAPCYPWGHGGVPGGAVPRRQRAVLSLRSVALGVGL